MKAISDLGPKEAQVEYERRTGDLFPVRPKRVKLRNRYNLYTAAGKEWVEACSAWELRFLTYYHKSVMRKAKK